MTPNSEILKEIKIPCVYAYTEPQFENTPWKKRDGKGIIKIGYTQRNVIERIQEQFPIKLPIDDPFSVLAEEVAIREDGSFFNDKDVHKVLERDFGARNAGGEWYEATIDEIRAAIYAVKTRTPAKRGRILAFKMRPEQKRAVEITSKYFSENSYLKTGKTPRFLWNAKMRFGKTFAAYQLAKKMGWKKILVLTFKPAVQSAWQEDLQSHVDFKDWQFVNREGLQFADADKTNTIVWFASFQDVMQKTAVGGIKARNEEIHATNWDCVIFDEYHFGAWRENAKELFINEEIDQSEYNIYKHEEVDYFDEEQMPISTNAYLYLSGTPFRAINSGEFLEDQIFSWTYSDEQRAKEFFSSQKQNPYKELPQMVLLTYQMPESIRQAALKGEFNEFDLNEFFKAEKIGGSYEFKHKVEVQKWLNLIRGQHIPTEIENLKTRQNPPMPFSDIRLLSANHSIWYLPNIASCKAMAALLMHPANSFYKDYKIIVCAGSEAGVGLNALPPVLEAVGKGFDTKTITLSCGKLLTGISIPQWGAILMLRNTKSPEAYFQSAFRVQTPWVLKNPDGLSPNEVQIVKEKCYVYDFAPDRALMQIAQYSSGLNTNSQISPEKKVEEFIHFLPVLCYDGSQMKPLNASEILDLLASGTASTMLARRWESALLVNVDNSTLLRIKNNPQILEILEKIEGFRNLNKDIEAILNKSDALKKLKREHTESNVAKPVKDEISEEQKEIKSLRKQIQEKLLKFASRIPIFMYLTDYREQTLKDIITKLDYALFKKVTGLDIKDFEMLVSFGVFNSDLMNQAIFSFKRFEDASLSYSGIKKHNEELVGGWDTTMSVEEVKAIYK